MSEEGIVHVDNWLQEPLDRNTIGEMSNGVQLKPRPFNRVLLRRIIQKHPTPEMPKYWNEATGEWDDNPVDPDYHRQLLVRATELLEETSRAVIIMGTQVHHLPEGVPPVESDQWVEELEYFGFAVDVSTRQARYAEWLLNVALPSEQDRSFAYSLGVEGMGGVFEADVFEALSFLADHARRRTDRELSAAKAAADGDSHPA